MNTSYFTVNYCQQLSPRITLRLVLLIFVKLAQYLSRPIFYGTINTNYLDLMIKNLLFFFQALIVSKSQFHTVNIKLLSWDPWDRL